MKKNKKTDLDSNMRQKEYFHGLTLVPGMWVVVRLDGRSFSKFTQKNFQKPFDAAFKNSMVKTAEALMEDLHGFYGWTSSDEISILLPPTWAGYGRSLEKTLSLSASLAGSTFSLQVGEAVQFDSRIWLGASLEDVLDYFLWRQEDSARCALQGWAYWTLRQSGKSAQEVTRMLNGTDAAFKNEMLFTHGINFNSTPLWQRRGVALYRGQAKKQGFNPLTHEEVLVQRQVLMQEDQLPMKEDYRAFLLQRLSQAVSHPTSRNP
ncbi:tRNA(His) guanylyltransferase Thg1 family protein [Deinococcus cellulosilyticus]|uniref:tRNA(His) guanylyltransferase n=1 Tax=Deinococcus cellulosilyticus (strain DSM 18568 / NBRC 106333 / KACC 11606 / 5516J-15) TaxID=1223518 RepID=A0A511MZ20_DEIC1|nr:tRNA(His) guanylyltransferase Thg1 family protein [Deinococcus cellulosilyticus]GEM45843.1 guanylyltransferase [Deinococcus cellulosilyticus NBRC 106333 = KACC 11606]